MRHTSTDYQSAFAGDGEVRLLLRTHDWSGFPFGRPEQWPPVIRRTIDMLLDSAAPMSFLWGPDHLYFYNDAYVEMLADKHPAALTRPFWHSWGEVRDVFAPTLQEAESGKVCNLKDTWFPILRNGVLGNAWFTYSLLPVFDAGGDVIGLLNPAMETTAEVLSHRGREFQLQLADHIRPLTDPLDVIAKASELLGEYLGVDRVVYAIADDTGETVSIERDWTSGRLPTMAGTTLQLDEFGPLAARLVREGKPLILADVGADERSARYASAYTGIGIRAALAIPLMKEGRLRVILNAHDAEIHHWTPTEIDMVVDMADRTWSAVEGARAQAELRYERDQSSYIFDSMGEGFALLDKDWRVLRMNAEGLRLTQESAEHVIGRNHWELWPDLAGTQAEQVFRRVMASREAAVLEIPYAFHDRNTIWMETRAYPALDGKLALFFRNITDRKVAEGRLRDADRRKDEFLAMLAHELRNPLAPIGAAADLLQMARLDEARVRQTSRIIGRQVRHMTSLIDDLLDVSRVTRGLVQLHMEPLDIHHIVTDAIEQVMPLIRSRRHHLALASTSDAPLVMGDRNRLVQVLANLLNNAAKYTHEGGRITLGTEASATHIRLHVTDNGIGMAPDLASRAFDLFTQAERSSDRSLGGLGLGLALVKSLVELHGGTVTCASPGPEKGSTFTVCLPRMTACGPGGAGHAVDASTDHGIEGVLRIMVVDDNADAASMLAMLLESAGHEVTVAHGAREALERSAGAPPDVFLLDIGLPEIDGNDLARGLRAQPGTAGAVLVAITGYGQETDREQTAAAGFDHHLVKPVDMEKLYAILGDIKSPERVGANNRRG